MLVLVLMLTEAEAEEEGVSMGMGVRAIRRGRTVDDPTWCPSRRQ